MDLNLNLILGLAAGLIASVSASVLVINLRGGRSGPDIRGLMGGQQGTQYAGPVSEIRERIRNDESGEELQRLKELTRKGGTKKSKLTLEERLFQAGVHSDKERADFQRLRFIAPVICMPVLGGFLYYMVGLDFGFYGLIGGLLLGLQVPTSVLDRKIKRRHDEILFYLPLVIEQIAIGVSSSLDVGPCLQRVVQMADERDSHNVVTELIRHAQFYIKSGAGMEDALNEIGVLSGNTELKHAFMSLSQVAKHGGEITRQLQELADAVASQRETKIEAKIKKLELEATGPVALVFAGFLIILLIGFGIQIQGAFT